MESLWRDVALAARMLRRTPSFTLAAIVMLAVGIAAATALLDLQLVVVGGGVAEKLGAPFVGRIEQAVPTVSEVGVPLALRVLGPVGDGRPIPI